MAIHSFIYLFSRVYLLLNYFGKDDGLKLVCLINKKREDKMTSLILKEILVPESQRNKAEIGQRMKENKVKSKKINKNTKLQLALQLHNNQINMIINIKKKNIS